MALTTTRQQICETAAAHFGLFHSGAVTEIDTDLQTVTLPFLTRVRANRDLFDKAYVTKDGVDFALITQTPTAAGVATLSENIPGLQDNDVVGVYLLLNPEDWRRLLNNCLTSELLRRVTTDVLLVDEQNEYELPEEIQSESDIVDVIFRDTATATVLENPAVYWKLKTNDNVVTLHLPDMWLLQTADTVVIQVSYRKSYDELDADTATTTCPFPLVWTSLAVRGAEFIQSAFGDAMAQRFREARNTAIRQRSDQRATHMPPTISREFNMEAPFYQENADIYDRGSW